MSCPVSTFKALKISVLKHPRMLRALPFMDWTNENRLMGHSIEN
ncbi:MULTISPECIES: hypothetical protein [Ochrobactrum]|uniref:Uncharacterized protein n=1 Tax=Ochrobactrum chromiisoli TaxID=2993941 RepID=A0ABT3QPE2_9HYPH|nr:hypothetical protein [Ochrobactrum chromiisoli]MCX2697469.1 hypothetical protein [Ochrobactrum chromiisoli]